MVVIVAVVIVVAMLLKALYSSLVYPPTYLPPPPPFPLTRRLDGNRRTMSGLSKQKSVFFPKALTDEEPVQGTFGNRNSFIGRSNNGK